MNAETLTMYEIIQIVNTPASVYEEWEPAMVPEQARLMLAWTGRIADGFGSPEQARAWTNENVPDNGAFLVEDYWDNAVQLYRVLGIVPREDE